ncbi:hypothetical protein [Leucobacter aridicollis]|uniref:hypothetical protein n=1 Tax=Leucobacter aridicollis TaxID=283878 RepID=UPI00216A86A7|nr:hypothetical protein [Leucobacter aridicollis]MCS3426762.1 hypothetical protein [Leucobacter aridicollis]
MTNQLFDPNSVTPAPRTPQEPQPYRSPPSQDDTGFNALWSLLNWSIFIDYFCYVGDKHYLDSDAQVRFQKHRTNHPGWYYIAVILDTILKVFIVALILIVLFSLALKVIK